MEPFINWLYLTFRRGQMIPPGSLKSCENTIPITVFRTWTCAALLGMKDSIADTVRENGVPNAVAPPKVSQRRAQPCAAVRRRIDTASSSAMIVLMS